MSFLLSDKKAIFFHTPKTGGLSIDQYLIDNTVGVVFGWHRPPWNAVKWNLISEKVAESWWKFAFVRNPWSHVVSVWEYRAEHKSDRHHRTKTFTQFIRWHYDRRPLKAVPELDVAMFPHSHFIYNEEFPKLEINHICRFENLQEDFNNVCKLLDIPVGKLDHINRARKYGIYPEYPTYYTEELQLMVAELYQEDIERFGYKF